MLFKYDFELEDEEEEIEIEKEEELEIIKLYGRNFGKENYKFRKGFSDKDCICGGHNAHNVKKNINNNSTKKRLEIRKKRRDRLKEKLKSMDVE